MEENILLKPTHIQPQLIEHFYPDGISLGFLNHLEHLDLRIQAREKKVAGYYAKFNGDKIFITENGKLDHRPNGFYTLYDEQLTKLI